MSRRSIREAVRFPTEEGRAFFRWGVGSYVAVTGVLLAVSLWRTDGTMIYALDDPAIHLSIAGNLAHHGTWGVVPGHFQSASSSPLWTVLLAVFITVLPFAANYAAFVVNALAAVAILALLGRAQTVLHPSRRRPLDVAAVAAVSVVLLFLPAATFVGMEHLVHAALILAAVHLVLNPPAAGASRLRRAAPYLLFALASGTRLETAFVAGALALALVLTSLPRPDGQPVPAWARQVRTAVLLCASAGLPIIALAVFNKAMGQSWLPNSVIAKSTALNGAQSSIDLVKIFGRLTNDAVLAAITVGCALLAIVGWRDRARWFVPTATMALATLAHVAVAQTGWYERYQIYLIVLGTYALAVAAQDLVPARTRRERPTLVPLLLLVPLILAATKVALTIQVPQAVGETYQQRYQAGRFLERYYHGRPIATGELGYISAEHHGPITDLLGLGDYEVMEARRSHQQRPPPSYWADLARRRGFRVAAVYPETLLLDTPKDWILVGTWRLSHDVVSAFDPDFQFWATTPEEVAPLIAHLREFSHELPPGVKLRINSLAEFRAEVLMGPRRP